MAHYTPINAQTQPLDTLTYSSDSVLDAEALRHLSPHEQSYGREHGANQLYEARYEYGDGHGHQATETATINEDVDYIPTTSSQNTSMFAHPQYSQTEIFNYPVTQSQNQNHAAVADYTNDQEYVGQLYPAEQQYASGQGYSYGQEYDKNGHYVYNNAEVVSPPSISDKPRRRLSFIHRLWIWEIMASVFSLACIGAVIGVLLYEQGKPLDQWQRGWGEQISPTAVVSFLGTMGKSACLLALAEIISQLKWIHFSAGPQRLNDLQVFDDASRGPLGALQLLVVKNRKTLLAMCASALVLAALLVDPFLQLVFTFPQQLTPVDGASPTIRTSQVYDPFALPSRYSQCYGAPQVDSVMQAAILSPVWNATRAPSLSCNFERCEWPSITTLGICSSCVDVTDHVSQNCNITGQNKDQIQCNYTLPNAGNLSAEFAVTGGAAERTPYHTLWHSSAKLANLTESGDALISHFSFIKLAADLEWQNLIVPPLQSPHLSSDPPIQQAMQCSFSFCARTFDSPYYANFSSGPLTGPQTSLLIESNPEQFTSAVVLLDLAPSSPNHPPMNATFTINECDYRDLSEYLMDLFTVEYWSAGMSDVPTSSGYINTQPLITPNIGLALSQAGDVPALMQEIADSMTEAFRNSVNSSSINGIGRNTVTYIAITWAWLSLPIALVVLTFVMLLVVVVRNNARGVAIWKSSSLALLFHNLEGWDEAEREARNPQDVKKRASEMTARAVNGGGALLFSRA
ncbi:hypothetical protein F4776DRAFT_606813 [Hypoxylon sp. NC0597]|nr:hypothetical protein F4776DRAFT_606813 [Hypoxylon sp. NC0597]